MFHRTKGSVRYACVLLVCLTAARVTVRAGQPLICHPYEIGNAQSLPWSIAAEKFSVKRDYELKQLVNDTLTLLTPATPVIVRMETLRRATIYAVWIPKNQGAESKALGQKIADELLARLLARAQATGNQGQAAALALFDAGYLLSSYRQSGWHLNQHTGLDAYAMVRQAAEQSGEATMEFAAALSTYDKTLRRAHLQKAIAQAPEGSLLARNLVSHFGGQSQNLAEMRTNLAATQ